MRGATSEPFTRLCRLLLKALQPGLGLFRLLCFSGRGLLGRGKEVNKAPRNTHTP